MTVDVPDISIDLRPLSEQVYAALVRLIVERRVAPGERLVLDDLALRFNVSRTPVQYALTRLSAEGLVQPTGRRGFCVTRLTRDDVEHLYQVRLMCEQFAVEEGAANLTPEVLALLEDLAAGVAQTLSSPDLSDDLAARRKDTDLHCAIVGLAHNPRLNELYERLAIPIQRTRAGPSPLTREQRGAITISEHQAILSALRSADITAGKLAVRAHILGAKSRILAVLDRE